MENEYKLDDEWIRNFEKSDQLLKDFYTDDVYYTNLHLIYINKNSEIEKIKEEKFIMQAPNLITKEEIIGILKRNSYNNSKQYFLLSLLKINIDLVPSDIRYFLKEDNYLNFSDSFLTPNKNIDDIVFKKTINMFQDLNDIIIVFYERTEIKQNQNHNQNQNCTKKVYLGNKHAKTYKKQFKDLL
jgi:hypothetical protein